MPGLQRELQSEMERWEAAGLRRRITEAQGPERIDFASNDTLGLARHPAVVEAARRALEREGAGGRAARLLGGGGEVHARVERLAAEWLGAEAALLVPSGYQANLALIGSLAGRGDAVLSDERNHASLVDGARLSRSRVLIHRHLDLEELERLLATAASARRRLVVTEGVFSMDGDAPDLPALAELCARHDATLIVDEAHAAGILGPAGAGALAAAGLVDGAPCDIARVVTGGKALGVGGAFVVGSRALIDHVVNHGRAFIFTTAPSPATAGALAGAIELVRGMDAERSQVRRLARALAAATGANTPAAAILRIPAGGPEDAVERAQRAQAAGFDLRAVRPPTVPPGASGLRVVVHAFNTDDECTRLAGEVGSVEAAEHPAVPRAERRALFVVGTDTGIGKTVVSAALLTAARRLGTAAYWKPVQTGDDSDTRSVRDLAGASAEELLDPGFEFPLPASPHEAAADAGGAVDPAALEARLRAALAEDPARRLVIELAGGLLVPYRVEGFAGAGPTRTQADWLAEVAAPLVLVARSGLGTLNHTLLTLEALRARHLEPRALFLVGPRHAANRETLERMGGIRHVFELPPLDPLDAPALEDWLERSDLSPILRP